MKMIDVIVGMAVMLTIGDKMDEEKGREGVRIIWEKGILDIDPSVAKNT